MEEGYSLGDILASPLKDRDRDPNAFNAEAIINEYLGKDDVDDAYYQFYQALPRDTRTFSVSEINALKTELSKRLTYKIDELRMVLDELENDRTNITNYSHFEYLSTRNTYLEEQLEELKERR